MATITIIETGEVFELSGDVVVVGRMPGCDVTLPTIAAARRQLEIRREGGGYDLLDLRQWNTRINGQHVALKDGERYRLRSGDRIGIAGLQLLFEDGGRT